jgi:hypothetical protein
MNFNSSTEIMPYPDLAYSADSRDDENLITYPFDESSHLKHEVQLQVHQLQITDVYRCKRDSCQVCCKSHVGPRFIPANKVQPLEQRRLPRGWEVAGESDEPGFFDSTFNLVCSLLEDIRCDDTNDDDDSGSITWWAGNLDKCSNWESPTNKGAEPSDDLDDMSCISSVNLREYHISTLDDESFPFDER